MHVNEFEYTYMRVSPRFVENISGLPAIGNHRMGSPEVLYRYFGSPELTSLIGMHTC